MVTLLCMPYILKKGIRIINDVYSKNKLKMKFKLKNILAVMAITLSLASCTKNEEVAVTPPNDELSDVLKFQEVENATHVIELYKHMSSLEQGYNEVVFRIKDKATNQYIKNATATWTPLMHMNSMAMPMTHSCPKSAIEKVSVDGEVYSGYLVFQMPQSGASAATSTDYWDLKIDYTINGTNFSMTDRVNVPASTKQRVTTFTGTDNVKYVVAYCDPHHPALGINDMVAGIWKMQDMMTFPIVNNYKLKIDPRMPSMGNHGSPNNVDLTQTVADDLYNGKLSLTMTGLWRINLQLLNASDEVLYGETVTDVAPSSSIYFEIEF